MAIIKTNLTHGTTGNLPAVNGSAVTALNASNVASGTLGIQARYVQGGDNKPAFSVVKADNDNQSISNNTDTKLTFGTEVLDSDGKFASNRFTPTVSGKYFIYAQAYHNSGNNSDMKVASLNIFKNGSREALSVFDARANQPRGVGMTISKIIDLDTDDYVELYAKIDTDDGSMSVDGQDFQTTFGGFKIIT